MSSQEQWIKSIFDSCWKPGQSQGGACITREHTGWAQSVTKAIGIVALQCDIDACVVLLMIMID